KVSEGAEDPDPLSFTLANFGRDGDEGPTRLDDAGLDDHRSIAGRGEVVSSNRHGIRPPGFFPHGPHRDRQEVAAVGVVADVPARLEVRRPAVILTADGGVPLEIAHYRIVVPSGPSSTIQPSACNSARRASAVAQSLAA